MRQNNVNTPVPDQLHMPTQAEWDWYDAYRAGRNDGEVVGRDRGFRQALTDAIRAGFITKPDAESLAARYGAAKEGDPR